MSEVKITDLAAATNIDGSELFVASQNGNPVKITTNQIGYKYTSVINMDSLFPLSTGYYTLETAIAAVPDNIKTLNAEIFFKVSANNIAKYQYQRSDLNGWNIPENWKQQFEPNEINMDKEYPLEAGYYSIAGTCKKIKVSLTAGVTTADNITFLGQAIAVTTDYSTAVLLAAYLATQTYSGWTISYISGNAYLELIYNIIGYVATPTIDFGSTEAAGSVTEEVAGTASAIGIVPTSLYALNKKICFKTSTSVVANYQYIGTAISPTSFCTSENWINISDINLSLINFLSHPSNLIDMSNIYFRGNTIGSYKRYYNFPIYYTDKYFYFCFYGKSLSLYGMKSPDGAPWNIYIDGELVSSVNTTDSYTNPIPYLFYLSTSLSDSFHTCVVKNESNISNSALYLAGAFADNHKILDSLCTLEYISTDGLTLSSDPNNNNDVTAYYKNVKRININIYCKSLIIDTLKNGEGGDIQIFIDGKNFGTFSFYSVDVEYFQLKLIDNNSNAMHHIEFIQLDSTKALYIRRLKFLSDREENINFDSFLIHSYEIGGTYATQRQEDDSFLSPEILSYTIDDINFIFYGTGIEIYVSSGLDRGIANIYIDDILRSTVNMTAPKADLLDLFSINTLSLGFHKLKITTMAQPSNSEHNWMYLSHIIIFGGGNRMRKIQQGVKYIEDFGGIGDGTTDDSSAFQLALDKCLEVGGELKLNNKSYLIKKSIVINNSNARQNAIKIIGTGAYMDGQELGIISSCSLILNNPDNISRFITTGVGYIEFSGITFRTTDTLEIPFILSIYTTLLIHGCSFVGSQRGTSCNQDAIVLGGTNELENRGSVTLYSGFQGYGTVINANYFLGIRRALYARTFCNGVIFRDNNIWRGCGSNLTNGAAVELDEVTTNAAQYNCGMTIASNLIEQVYYPIAIKLGNTTFNNIDSNNIFDVGSGTVAICGIFIGSQSHHNRIVFGYPSYGYLIANYVKYQNQSTIGHNFIFDAENKINSFID